MADTKNFGLKGVGNDIQLGKAGSRINLSGSIIQARNAADGAFVIVRGLDPIGDTDLATKLYVDSVAQGLDHKQSCTCASTADVSGTYNSTAGPDSNGQHTGVPAAIDGVTLAQGDRVLLKNQSPADENGIYEVQATTTTLNRAIDFNEDTDVTAGAFTFIEEGTVNADSGWVLQGPDPLTVGTGSGSDLNWVLFSTSSPIAAGVGLIKNGDQFDLDFSELTSAATIATSDELIFQDSGVESRITVANFISDRSIAVTVGTPADNQIGVWTGDGTIEGDADLTYNSATGLFYVNTTNGTAGSVSVVAPGIVGLFSADASAVTVTGGAMNLISGAGNTTGAGGLISVTGGIGGATGAGGALTLTGGAGGGTSGAGGALTLTGGASPLLGDGGDFNIAGGASAGSNSYGGTVTINSGTGNGTGSYGGDMNINAGTGVYSGGNVTVNAGSGYDAGRIALTAGAGSQYGGSIQIVGGSSDYDPGDALLRAGAATAGNRTGGILNLNSGVGFGTGAGGAINIVAFNSGAGATGTGGGVTITSGASAATNGASGAMNITTPAGTGTGAGGVFNITAGASGAGATGDGGAVAITAGSTAATIGSGGNINITAGTAVATGSSQQAGDVLINAGSCSGSGAGGTGVVTLIAGAQTITGRSGGQASLVGGAGAGPGGQASVTGGNSTSGGAGGNTNVTGGAGNDTGNGGASRIIGGQSGSGVTGDGGAIIITAGASVATNGAGGAVNLTSGAGNGSGADGIITISSGAVEAIRFTGDGTDIIVSSEANVGLTADVGSAQGNGVITSTYNVYSTVGTAGDAATLPAVFPVGTQIYIKNDGANSMDVFPASGDDAGAGTNTAVVVTPDASVTFIGTTADATWTELVVGGDSPGTLDTITGTVDLSTASVQNIGAATGIPADCTILSVLLRITTASDAATTVTVGDATNGAASYMTATENNPELLNETFIADTWVANGAVARQATATVAVNGTVGAATCIITFRHA